MTGPALVLSVLAGGLFVAGSGGLYQALNRAPARIVSPVLGAYPMLSLAIAAAQGAGGCHGRMACRDLDRRRHRCDSRDDRDGGGALRGSDGGPSLGHRRGRRLPRRSPSAGRPELGATFPSMLITRLTALLCTLALGLAFRSIRPAPARLPFLLGMETAMMRWRLGW